MFNQLKLKTMLKFLVTISLIISGFVNSQEPVYVAGEDEVSWVLQSGVGEKILGQYELEYCIGDLTANMIDSIKSYFNDSLLDLYDPSNGEHPYTKLNTEVIYESHITQEELNLDFSFYPFAQFIFDSLLVEFKNSGVRLDSGERYLVIYQLELHYIPGTPLTGDIYSNSDHIVLKILRVLN
jgi:hypothetical protein